ncbi:SDR family NAD(P)-dependent oxidoreductase [Elioraea sp. Yellowstone]|jgi:NAD(P)-dependent dehydrogenase (short-subunit alcohol dehydrogenase family)|uniref:SDR family NAD(P)-dependent oxidoreductase n=1 Tax=Elioraea sp. Yellowstone TaxID=2592070 RepID=UPI0011542544|nr:SDR family NAD(P)-dependent oxidoreductase [Elioraea sp. Yellowstone]TQF78215.1 SDR family NAD(P)-dependent oxidoreductase [Elioraea sp. Yellowstone]
MLEAEGRVAMVSGAARGIGRAVVLKLLASGFSVSAGVRDRHGLPASNRLFAHRYDAEDPASADAWAAATADRFGRIDAVVAAAGINPMARLLDRDDTALDALWAVNVKGPKHLVRAAWPHLVASGSGRVAILASLSGKRVANENMGYAASKFAAVALAHAIRREGWDHGIRATAICPGFVDTDMTAHVTRHPREQMSRPEDIAALIETVLRLPAHAVVAELLVNCRLEPML